MKKDTRYKYDGNGRIISPESEALKNIPKDGGELWNRLVFEQSPYLLQHAANPVDWYPWGEEAFAKATREDKPIFLSIGYTTCHWCHVMEHESFEDNEVAALLNESYIAIKVDREERPDIDNVYMSVTQMLTGRGGWPMTVIMTPEKEPFFAGTYLPKQTRGRRAGMMELLPNVKTYWDTKRDSLLQDAGKLTQRLKNSNKSSPSGESLSDNILDKTFSIFDNRFDETYGGFGNAHKFPKPHDYLFLLKYYSRTKNNRALEMAEKSLIEMRKGGMYDQLGFGFHRYSTDKSWLVPHFEKMLYDQALLVHAYLEAYQVTRNQFYADVVREILEYVERDMTSPEGGFYSAEDADSEGEEGLFYLWTTSELDELLGESDSQLFQKIMNIRDNGNWNEGRRHGSTNIPHLKQTWSHLARVHQTSENELKDRYEKIRVKLFDVREFRIHPQKDDKILSDWNGLMISAFAKAAVVLNDEKYTVLAENAANFVLTTLRAEDGGLLKRSRKGEAGIHGLIEDYAFVIWGLIELYQLTFNVDYLESAVELSDYQFEHFWDSEGHGFFFTPDNAEQLLVRTKEVYDGAIPSGNSVAAYNFIRLGRILSRADYEDISHQTMTAFARNLNRSGSGYTLMLQGVEYFYGPAYEVLIFGDPESIKTQKMVAEIRNIPQPNKVVVFAGQDGGDLQSLIPFVGMYPSSKDGSPLVYVCQNYSCNLPTDDIEKVRAQLGN
ncbi:MAG: thioredoxin domain-containing protein [Candidatus Marinimicrobia bacterium]|nr:thioredoxin domain-containing protein [Candidatus Neomarinimicrobiota bacterium]